jgi:hypothetical protein
MSIHLSKIVAFPLQFYSNTLTIEKRRDAAFLKFRWRQERAFLGRVQFTYMGEQEGGIEFRS